jgi:hypothetical protein
MKTGRFGNEPNRGRNPTALAGRNHAALDSPPRGFYHRTTAGVRLLELVPMKPNHPTRLLLIGNAALLLVVAILLVGRLMPSARGQTVATPMPTTAPLLEIQPANLTMMPAQISANGFGCYVLDSTHQTISIYEYLPGDHDLKFLAARDISFDHRMKSFNTSPPPSDIKAIVEHAESAPRVRE